MNKRCLSLLVVCFSIMAFCFTANASLDITVIEKLPADLDLVVKKDFSETLAIDYAVMSKIMLGSFSSMMKYEFWVFELEGNIVEVTAAQDWGDTNSVTELRTDNIGSGTAQTVRRYGDKLAEEWGSDWLALANEKAIEYQDQYSMTQIIVLSDSDTFDVYTITFITPWVCLRTFEITEGLFMIITKLSLNF